MSQGNFNISGNQLNNYVDRGDPAAFDFQVGALVTDGNWQNMDLSAIVPANAVAVHINIRVSDGAVGNVFDFRKNGNSNVFNQVRLYTLVASQYTTGNLIVACDADRVIEYRATNTTWTAIDITVSGWFV